MLNMCNNKKLIHVVCLLSICGPVPVSMQERLHYYPIETPVPRVINGTLAKKGQFPYQVSLRRARKGGGYDSTKQKYYSFCGGSIIREDKVLTAAHCICEEGNACDKYCARKAKVVPTKGIYVVAGAIISRDRYQKENGTQWKRIERGVPKSAFKFPQNDIALIYLAEPFSFNEYVNALPYATVRKNYNQKNKCVVSGYGRTAADVKGGSPYLLWANIDMLSEKECSKRFKDVMKTSGHICYDDKYSSSHKGDSGGPLVCFNTGDPAEKSQGVIVGVVCGHTKCKKAKCGPYFTRISSFKDFVDSATKSKEIIYYYNFLILFYFCQNLTFIKASC